MDIQKILSSLHPLERSVFPYLKVCKSLNELSEKTGLQPVEAMRALEWLANKTVLELKQQTTETIELGENGKFYLQNKLPERQAIEAIKEGANTILKLQDKLGKQEAGVAIGQLKAKNAVEVNEKLNLTSKGEKIFEKETPEEELLKILPKKKDELKKDEKQAFENLYKRKNIIKINEQKDWLYNLTETGKKLVKQKLSEEDMIDTLTPQMLSSGSWKGKIFRRYDVNVKVPKIHGGRRHPLSAVINLLRDIFVEMGFEEMQGPWVETSFWCMDSMWIPQDHPSREVQDTFYLPYKGKLPNKKIVEKVKAVHENGGKCGSKGYGYEWNPEVAKQLLLRTHTTATTYRYFGLEDIKDRERAKFFSVGRVFRNEAIDATHLPEFHQIEGFVMDDGLTLKDLMGMIKAFYAKMGIHKIKFKITYNPYTESSLEAMYYDEHREKWLELINSGVFRPESVEPYGIKKPVIAWGIGVERLAMILYELDKLRDILGPTCDLSWLRKYKIPIRK
ncbi:MAG: phenylalanine--tRNA ligase subunit alpha [Nanoarchaeota archaeon]